MHDSDRTKVTAESDKFGERRIGLREKSNEPKNDRHGSEDLSIRPCRQSDHLGLISEGILRTLCNDLRVVKVGVKKPGRVSLSGLHTPIDEALRTRHHKQHRKKKITKLEHNLCRRTRDLSIFPIKRPIHTMRLLLDGHWELLERPDIKPTLPNDSSEFSSQAPFVVLTSKERD